MDFSLNGIPYMESTEKAIPGDLFRMPNDRVIQSIDKDHIDTLLAMGGKMIKPVNVKAIIARISPYVFPGLQ